MGNLFERMLIGMAFLISGAILGVIMLIAAVVEVFS